MLDLFERDASPLDGSMKSSPTNRHNVDSQPTVLIPLRGTPQTLAGLAAHELSITEQWEKAIYVILFGCFLGVLTANF